MITRTDKKAVILDLEKKQETDNRRLGEELTDIESTADLANV